MKTNNVPFFDECLLIKVIETDDSDGYETKSEERVEVYCSISDGVTRSEMYEAMKAGIKLTGTAEIWEEDYDKQQLLEYDGIRFKIERAYPTGHGTLELSLSQEVH